MSALLLQRSHLREIRESLASIEEEALTADGPGKDWLHARLYQIIYEVRHIEHQLDIADAVAAEDAAEASVTS